MELFEAGFHCGQFRPDMPVAQLRLTLKSFDTDCFMIESRTFVSERMRNAMALPSSAVQYFDVDARWIPYVEVELGWAHAF